jgi:altronate hydrolase
MANCLQISVFDNVAVAIDELQAGDVIEIQGKRVEIKEKIERGHKFALLDITVNENVVKYGSPIGHAIKAIAAGQHVHSQNIKTNLNDLLEYSYKPQFREVNIEKKSLTFKGFRRFNGDVGIRNELWIIPTVGCVNGVGEKIIETFKAQVNPVKADSVTIFKHNYGCSQLGDDHVNTRNILADIVLHPNAGGVLVLGLGCENNQVEEFVKELGGFDPNRVKFLITQKVGDEIAEGVTLLKQIYAEMEKDVRTEVPISELKVGLKCGGSDGFSGITANPFVGLFSDFLIAQGGTTILTEVPEMFGAETLLMERAENIEVFDKTVEMINDFKQYYIKNNQPVYENPSPGNKAGGITTLEEKSLGCTQKGGNAKVTGVLKYGERLKSKGLNLLSGPGNDLVSCTALGSAGCHLVLFTTGRGTPFGSFVPTLKISTNSQLAANKPNWIDFNTGVLLEGKDRQELLNEFIDRVIAVASGQLSNNEKYNYREIAIFKSGVTL